MSTWCNRINTKHTEKKDRTQSVTQLAQNIVTNRKEHMVQHNQDRTHGRTQKEHNEKQDKTKGETQDCSQ